MAFERDIQNQLEKLRMFDMDILDMFASNYKKLSPDVYLDKVFNTFLVSCYELKSEEEVTPEMKDIISRLPMPGVIIPGKKRPATAKAQV